MQDGKPIAYFSQALCPKNQALSTYEKELLAIMTAVQKWSGYLVGARFVITKIRGLAAVRPPRAPPTHSREGGA